MGVAVGTRVGPGAEVGAGVAVAARALSPPQADSAADRAIIAASAKPILRIIRWSPCAAPLRSIWLYVPPVKRPPSTM